MSSYYDIFNVNKDATQQEIKKAYFSLAKKFHPDTTDLSEEEALQHMIELNTAYAVLSNPDEREIYDCKLNGISGEVMYADPNNPYANNAYIVANEIVQKQCRECRAKLEEMLGTGIAITNMEQLWQQFLQDVEYTIGRLKAVDMLLGDTVLAFDLTIDKFAEIYVMADELSKAYAVKQKQLNKLW